MLKVKDGIDPKFVELLRDVGLAPEGSEALIPKLRAELEAPKARKVFEVPKTSDPLIRKALECFLNTDETKARFGHYFVDGNELYYRAVCTNNSQQHLQQNLIAVKIPRAGETLIVGNSSALGLIGRRSAWGHEKLNRNETEVQRALSVLVPMIPFNVFEEAELDLSTIEMIERGPEESVLRKRETGKWIKDKREVIEETVHFTGASLFTLAGGEGSTYRYFLFDIDRREIEHKIFNAFLVELPSKVNSIAEAYELLKPEAVKHAEKRGLEVKRQGEFFFLPASPLQVKRLQGKEDQAKELELRTGPNRPNRGKGIQIYRGVDKARAGKIVPDLGWRASETADREAWRAVPDLAEASEYYFTGKVEHTGREHAALILKGWWVAVPNTAQRSFTITGDVD